MAAAGAGGGRSCELLEDFAAFSVFAGLVSAVLAAVSFFGLLALTSGVILSIVLAGSPVFERSATEE